MKAAYRLVWSRFSAELRAGWDLGFGMHLVEPPNSAAAVAQFHYNHRSTSRLARPRPSTVCSLITPGQVNPKALISVFSRLNRVCADVNFGFFPRLLLTDLLRRARCHGRGTGVLAGSINLIVRAVRAITGPSAELAQPIIANRTVAPGMASV